MILETDPYSKYQIDLPAFTGPLDLLLHLIDRSELDITVISLARVTEQYLQQIQLLKQQRTERLIDFLSVGARLLVIKSRALLPVYDQYGLDEEDEEDPGEALARQLREYRRFRQLGEWLKQKEMDGTRTFIRISPPSIKPAKPDLSGISVQTLIDAVRGIRDRQHMLEESVSVATAKQRYSIEQQIQLLRKRLDSDRILLFDTLLTPQSSWSEVSATLLAVLELIKRHELNARQRVLFGPIELIAESPKTIGP